LDTGEEWIVKLVKEVVENPEKYKEEAKFLLKLKTWYRQGGSYVDEAFYKVLWGEVDEVVVGEWDSGYPYERGEEIVLIPKAVPTVILHRVIQDYGERIEETTVYVFTGRNWVSVLIR